MKRHTAIFLLTICCALVSLDGMAQEHKKWDRTKGFHFVPLPSVSYNSDDGLFLGGKLDVYNFGDGSNYPNYNDKIKLDFKFATKGSKTFHLFYDSPALIHNHRLTFACTYNMHKFYPFWGFNGMSAPIDQNLNLNKDTRTAFYSVNWNMLRTMATIQGKIAGGLKWVGGLTLWKYDISEVNSKDYDSQNTLYSEYIKYGLIDEAEKNGGTHLELKAGLTFDNRDFEANPSSGIWFESFLYGSKDFFQKRNDYLKIAVHFRQYLPLIRNRLTFAYHLAYQDLLAGSTPFYLNQEIATVMLRRVETDGLGGMDTVRGILSKRMVGNGYAWGNFELRAKLFELELLGFHLDFCINPFFDMGAVIRPYKADIMSKITDPRIYSGQKEKLHMSAGCGVKVNVNYNIVLSAELAKPFMRQDGSYGLNLSMDYMF